MGMRDDHVECTVGEAASLVGVSVRPLHHLHGIGLAAPRGRSYSGYRLYSDSDIDRLYRILLYRETGMPLATIAELIDDPALDPAEHLERQRALLAERISHLQGKIAAVDQLMKEMRVGKKVTSQERAKILGDRWNPAWEAEAEERWGGTAEWQQSKVADMTVDDWKAARMNVDALDEALAQAWMSGVEAGSEEANQLAELHLAWLNEWVETTRSKQVVMARMYTDDARFAAHYDDRAPGLAAWVRAIIEENARSRGIDPDSAEWK